MVEWFEDDEFWQAVYPFLFTAERLGQAETEVEQILALVPRPVGSVLDLCCGPGRHALALARRGLRVTAVDRTAFYLDRAREQASREGLEVEWVLDDMRRHQRRRAYDLVLNLFTSFGYFRDAHDERAVLRNMWECLRPEGALVMDLVGKEWIAGNFEETTCDRAPDGAVLVRHHRITDQWSRIRNEWTLIREGKARSFAFSHTLYSGVELRDRLLDAGFQEVRLFGDLEGGAYGFGAKRLVALALR